MHGTVVLLDRTTRLIVECFSVQLPTEVVGMSLDISGQ